MDPDMLTAAQAAEDVSAHIYAVAQDVEGVAGHTAGLKDEVNDALSAHGVAYDEPSDTGDSTRGELQAVLSEIDEQLAQLNEVKGRLEEAAGRAQQVAEDIRAHAARLAAALEG